jgi:hypothetical protein
MQRDREHDGRARSRRGGGQGETPWRPLLGQYLRRSEWICSTRVEERPVTVGTHRARIGQLNEGASLPEMDFADRQDFEDTRAELIGSIEPCVVHADDERVVWDNDSFSFLSGKCLEKAKPSLWRQGQLCAKQVSTKSPKASSRFAAHDRARWHWWAVSQSDGHLGRQ